MAIAYKSQGAGAGTETSGAALNLVCPATVDANDILISQVIHTGTTTAPSTPANWSLLYGPANIGTTTVAGRHWVFGKIADGTEDGATVSFGTAGGTNGRAGRIYSFSGYVSGTLSDVVPAASFSDIAHATDPQGPTVVTTVAGAMAVALTTQTDNNTEEAMTGMTGGTWGSFITFVSTSLGPVGLHIDIEVAIPTADPGTISGGEMTAANDPASTIGFEIRPSAPANVLVTPGVVALALAMFAPVVTATVNVLVTVGVLALALTTFAPSVLTPQTVTPTTATRTLTAFAPNIGIGVLATPSPASLVGTPFAPTVTATAQQTVVPSTLAHTIATFAPSVTTGTRVVIGVLNLGGSSAPTMMFIPKISLSGHIG